jgi:hypothetical protein
MRGVRTGASADRRAATVFAVSAAVWVLVLLQVDRRDQHVEVRELRWWQVLAFAFGMLGSAAAVHLAASYGPWSWLSWVGQAGRDAAVALVALAFVLACYFVMLLFR